MRTSSGNADRHAPRHSAGSSWTALGFDLLEQLAELPNFSMSISALQIISDDPILEKRLVCMSRAAWAEFELRQRSHLLVSPLSFS